VDEQGLSWSNDEEFVKNVLDTILSPENMIKPVKLDIKPRR
jgi:hypothetical protein